MKKYELTNESITTDTGILLFRIKCIIDIPSIGIRVGDKGGFIESCDNLSDNAWVFGDARVCGNARVSDISDYIVFKNWWSSGRYFTWTRSNNKWVVGCFYGTGDELIKKAYKDSDKSGQEYEHIVKYVNSIISNNLLRL